MTIRPHFLPVCRHHAPWSTISAILDSSVSVAVVTTLRSQREGAIEVTVKGQSQHSSEGRPRSSCIECLTSMLTQAIRGTTAAVCAVRQIQSAISSVFSNQLNQRTMTNTHTSNGEVITTEKAKRGALIVIEGCDRTGKTTQAKKLVDNLNAKGQKAVFMRFPDRSTQIGGLIDGYLSQGVDLEDQVIHLLFSANRWESLPKMKYTLESGTSIIIDRYAYSGVAFSAAKKGLGLEWCKGSDAGLPKPDAVLFLDLPPEAAATRGEYGNERYEKLEFQNKVYENYMALKDATWKMIDASKSMEEVESSITAAVDEVIEREKSGILSVLWD